MTGLAILGCSRFEDHVEAAKRIPGLDIVCHVASPSAMGVDFMCCDSREEALGADGVDAVVINVEAAEREYWAGQAAAAEKHALVESPVVSTFSAAKELTSRFSESGVHLTIADELTFSPAATEGFQLANSGTLGQILYLESRVAIPRAWLSNRGPGVVISYGSSLATIMEGIGGRIDTVYSRARSLAVNRPHEDLAIVQLRFVNGVEGCMIINGLCDSAEMRLEIHGSESSTTLSQPLPVTQPGSLDTAYESFAASMVADCEPAGGRRRLVESMFVVNWIQQSARLGGEIGRREVKTQ